MTRKKPRTEVFSSDVAKTMAALFSRAMDEAAGKQRKRGWTATVARELEAKVWPHTKGKRGAPVKKGLAIAAFEILRPSAKSKMTQEQLAEQASVHDARLVRKAVTRHKGKVLVLTSDGTIKVGDRAPVLPADPAGLLKEQKKTK